MVLMLFIVVTFAVCICTAGVMGTTWSSKPADRLGPPKPETNGVAPKPVTQAGALPLPLPPTDVEWDISLIRLSESGDPDNINGRSWFEKRSDASREPPPDYYCG